MHADALPPITNFWVGLLLLLPLLPLAVLAASVAAEESWRPEPCLPPTLVALVCQATPPAVCAPWERGLVICLRAPSTLCHPSVPPPSCTPYRYCPQPQPHVPPPPTPPLSHNAAITRRPACALYRPAGTRFTCSP